LVPVPPGQNPPFDLIKQLRPPRPGAERKWFNSKDAAKYAGLSVETIRDAAQAGDLSGCKRGRFWLFTAEAIDEWIEHGRVRVKLRKQPRSRSVIERPSREECLRRAAQILVEERAKRDAMDPHDAALAAHRDGGPSVEELEARIRRMRGMPPAGPGSS
jgi:excisionase family DNA binding protein